MINLFLDIDLEKCLIFDGETNDIKIIKNYYIWYNLLLL